MRGTSRSVYTWRPPLATSNQQLVSRYTLYFDICAAWTKYNRHFNYDSADKVVLTHYIPLKRFLCQVCAHFKILRNMLKFAIHPLASLPRSPDVCIKRICKQGKKLHVDCIQGSQMLNAITQLILLSLAYVRANLDVIHLSAFWVDLEKVSVL